MSWKSIFKVNKQACYLKRFDLYVMKYRNLLSVTYCEFDAVGKSDIESEAKNDVISHVKGEISSKQFFKSFKYS